VIRLKILSKLLIYSIAVSMLIVNPAAAAPDRKDVLILNSYHQGYKK
jgi:hypothetical protein